MQLGRLSGLLFPSASVCVRILMQQLAFKPTLSYKFSFPSTLQHKRGCCMTEITIKNLLVIEFCVLLLF